MVRVLLEGRGLVERGGREWLKSPFKGRGWILRERVQCKNPGEIYEMLICSMRKRGAEDLDYSPKKKRVGGG